MSDEEKESQKGNLRVLEFDRKKNENANEANKVVSEMFKNLSERAAKGDIQDFIITFKSDSRGIESMIGAGGGITRFDFVGYLGMLEILKARLLDIMSQMTYGYEFEPEDKPETDNEPEDPKV